MFKFLNGNMTCLLSRDRLVVSLLRAIVIAGEIVVLRNSFVQPDGQKLDLFSVRLVSLIDNFDPSDFRSKKGLLVDLNCYALAWAVKVARVRIGRNIGILLRFKMSRNIDLANEIKFRLLKFLVNDHLLIWMLCYALP